MRILAVVVVLLLWAPLLPAQPIDDAVGQWPDRPAMPDGIETGIIPVDETQRDAHRRVSDAASSTWQALGDTAEFVTATAADNDPLLVLYRDGMGVGDEGRLGGFGDPLRKAPDGVWVPSQAAARTGSWGLDAAPGTYPAATTALHLSPEIDLRTGGTDVVHEVVQVVDTVDITGDAATDTANEQASDTNRTLFALARAVRDAVANAAREIGLDAVAGALEDLELDREAPQAPYVPIEGSSQGTTHAYRAWVRYNLQDGDGVQFRAYSGVPDGTSCDEDCTILEPMEGYDGSTDLGPAFTGHSPWRLVTFDLASHAQDSLRVGMVLDTGACPAGCTQDASRFDQDAGFAGFHLDDAKAWAPAPEHSVRIHVPDRPDTTPPGSTEVVVAPGKAIPVRVDAGNMGQSEEEMTVEVELRDADGTVAALPLQTATIVPGAVMRVTGSFAAQPEGDYTLHARVSGVPDDVDPDDNEATLALRVAVFRDLRMGDLQAWADSAPAGSIIARDDPLAYRIHVRNLGNVNETMRLTGSLTDVTDHVVLDRATRPADDLLDGTVRELTLAPGATAHVVWNVTTDRAGQYEFSVQQEGGPRLSVPAIGIDRSPPPLFVDVDSHDAPRGGFVGEWNATGEINRTGAEGPWRQGWQRGGYLPGHDILYYMGMTEDSACPFRYESPCPYALHRSGEDFAPHNPPLQPPGDTATLTTPAISVPVGVDDPHLVFKHQLSTFVDIRDCVLFEPCQGRLYIYGIGRLEGRVGIEGPGGVEWQDWLLLHSEETPEMRGLEGERVAELTSPGSPASPRRYEFSQNDGFYCNDVTVGEHHFRAPCGWWHPSGVRDSVYLEGFDYSTAVDFGNGSPWRVERVPLNALHGEGRNEPLAAQGNVVQFRFLFPQSGSNDVVARSSQFFDDGFSGNGREGWRISSVAVTSTGSFLRDLAVDDVQVMPPYDAARIGIGPGDTFPVHVTVVNNGLLAVDTYDVDIKGITAHGATPLPGCTAATTVSTPIEPGQQRVVALDCQAPDDGHLHVRARVTVPSGDDLPLDNTRWDRGHPVQAHPDLRINATASPTRASQDTTRSISLRVENVGNVPVQGADVGLAFAKVTGLADVSPVSQSVWQVAQTIPVGGTVDLAVPGVITKPPIAPRFDLFFDPPTAGTFLMDASVRAPGDKEPSNDRQLTTMQAWTVLFGTDFESPEQRDPAVALGPTTADGPWDVAAGGFRGSAARLLAGDPDTGEIPEGTDAAYTLPGLDLSTVKDASLSFFHRYDLETGYDGARVEISLNGGDSWDTLMPRPARGITGYPQQTLVGDTPFLDGGASASGLAYTGKSADLPAALEGWVPAEFALGDYPGLQRVVDLDAFPLVDLPPRPDNQPRSASDNQLQWTTAGWLLDEDGALEAERYWWIHNATYGTPSRDLMWWSGSRDHHTQKVYTNLTFTLPEGTTHVSWWDWRDGWLDKWGGGRQGKSLQAPDLDRSGRGGLFEVIVDGQDVSELVAVLEREPDGWTQRSIEATQEITFRYIGDRSSTATRGWFIEGVAADAGDPGEPVVTRHEGLDGDSIPYLDVAWTCIGFLLGCTIPEDVPARPGAWHLDAVDLPDRTHGPAWRFADDSSQGYPHGADSRLVTPVVDLARVAGEQAAFRFDHRFGFESSPGCVAFGSNCHENPSNTPPRLAHDGGMVEVQVFNETSGTFGPWMPLLADHSPAILEIHRMAVRPPNFGFRDDTAAYSSIDRFYEMGYPAIQFPDVGSGLTHVDLVPVGAGGTSGGSNLRAGNSPFQVIPVYSGVQEDWSSERFDVSQFLGSKVRFAFHAWTDSNYLDNQPLEGWTISDVAVEATAFDGKPASLRLRVATDDSLAKGEWSIDDLVVVGERYERNVAIVPDEGPWRTAPGQDFDVTGTIRNMGTEPRLGLAWRAVAEDAQGNELGVVLERVREGRDNIVYPPIPTDQTGGVTGMFGPFDLPAGTAPGAQFPFLARVDGAPEGRVELRIEVFEDQGSTVEEDGQFVHYPSYEKPLDEVPGTTRVRVPIEVGDIQALALAPDGSDLLEATPTGSQPGQEIVLRTRVQNEGSADEQIVVRWRIVDRATGNTVHTKDDPRTSAPGADESVEHSWTPGEASVYRAHVELRLDGSVVQQAHVDLPVGTPLVYLDETFEDDAGIAQAFIAHGGVAGTPNQWRVHDGHLLWGPTTEAALQDEDTYCREAGEVLCPEMGTGPEAWARTAAPVAADLRMVPGDAPVLVVDHDWRFVSGDGGIVEVAVYRDPEDPSYLCNDSSSSEAGQPHWFTLEPAGGYAGSTASGGDWINPLGTVPAFAGRGEATTRFELNQSLLDQADGKSATCRNSLEDGLLGDQVAFRFHTGVRASNFPLGDRGWRIDGLSAGVGALALGPHDDSETLDRTLPILPGASKRFLFEIRNDGPVDDVVLLSAEGPDWIEMPDSLSLARGESKMFPVDVLVPPGSSVGLRPFTLRAESAVSSAGSTLAVGLDVLSLAMPDLAVELRLEDEGPLTAGSAAALSVVVTNQGDAPSEPVLLRLQSQPVGGAPATFHEVQLPELCPFRDCGRHASRHTVGLQWLTPMVPGEHVVEAVADPLGRLLEDRLDNNVDSRNVHIELPRSPDLAVLDLVVDGADAAGRVEAGGFFTLNATVANLGTAPAHHARIQLLLGGTVLAEHTFPEIAPGGVVTATALKAAPPGEFVVKAIVFSDSEQADLRPDNDVLSRILRVRGHDFTLTSPDTLQLAPGGTVTTTLSLRNEVQDPERLRISLVDAPGWKLDVFPNPLVLLPEADATAFLVLQAPANATAGSAVLRLQAMPEGLPHLANETELHVEVAHAPGELDLEVVGTDVEFPDVTVDLVVRNTGNLARSLAVEAGGLQGTHDLSALPHSSLEVLLAFTLPLDAPPGRHEVPIVAGGAQATAVVEVPERRDVETAWSVDHVRVAPDGATPMALTLAVRHPSNVPLDLDPRLHGIHGDVHPAMQRADPGQDVQFTITARFAGPAPEALDGHLELRHDLQPVATATLPEMPPVANLVLEEVRLDGRLRSDRATPLSAVVRNDGTAASAANYLLVYRNTQLQAAVAVPGLEPGKSVTLEASTRLPAGSHALVVVVDGDTRIAESRKDDNGISRLVHVDAADGFLTPMPLFVLAAALAVAAWRRRP